MYGFCSDGTSPAPSRGTWATVANGLATKLVANAKNAQAPPRNATRYGISSRERRRCW